MEWRAARKLQRVHAALPKDTHLMPDLARIRPLYRVGDIVLVKGTPVPKGCSHYQGPLHVMEVLGHFMFQLSDGQRWSVWSMKHYYEPQTKATDVESKLPPPPAPLRRHSHQSEVHRQSESPRNQCHCIALAGPLPPSRLAVCSMKWTSKSF